MIKFVYFLFFFLILSFKTIVLAENMRPHDNCYWAVPGCLLASEYPSHYNKDIACNRLNRYLDAGITFFLDLTEETEVTPSGPLVPYAELLQTEAAARNLIVKHCRMPIKDMSIPSQSFM